jgi:hypothetical protein
MGRLLCISYIGNSLGYCGIFGSVQEILDDPGIPISKESRRYMKTSTFSRLLFGKKFARIRDMQSKDNGVYIADLEADPERFDTLHAAHATPLLRQGLRELKLRKIGI